MTLNSKFKLTFDTCSLLISWCTLSRQEHLKLATFEIDIIKGYFACALLTDDKTAISKLYRDKSKIFPKATLIPAKTLVNCIVRLDIFRCFCWYIKNKNFQIWPHQRIIFQCFSKIFNLSFHTSGFQSLVFFWPCK